MATQKVLVVPGMPIAALNAVRDENARQVLSALVDAHNVRNGATGKGDQRFITAAEVGLTNGNSSIQVTVAGDAAGRNSPLLTPAAINRIITDLQSSVIESPLFKDLGERVDLIDQPGGIFDQLKATEVALINETSQRITADTAEAQARQALGVRVGTNEGAIVDEQSARANADNVIVQSTTTQFSAVNKSLGLVQTSVSTLSNSVSSVSSQVTQVQASVGANTTAIKQESTARATSEGLINSKYTIKIDNNGYVAGYGLMSTANNSVPFSEFIVRADRFAIGSVSGPGITPQVPFIVITSPQMVGGQLVQPGVYIQNAVIMDGSITRAKIGDLEVDTLKIKGNAVTVPFARSYPGVTSGAGLGNFLSIAVGAITLDYPGVVFVATTGDISYGTGFIPAQSQLKINGQVVAFAGGEEAYLNTLHSVGLYCNAGVVNVELLFSATDSRARVTNPTLFIQGAKR